MSHLRGHSRPISLYRRLVIDFLHASRNRPLVPIERRMRLAPLVNARALASPRLSWCALLTKAYAIVAARHPVLRRAYLPLPWPRFYEHPENVAAVVVERHFADESVILTAQLRRPEQLSLVEVASWLRQCKEAPLESVGSYRRALRIARLPWPLRRLAWWIGVDWWGSQRARCLGTFGVSVTGGMGAGTLALVTPWTTALHCAPLEEDGALPMRLTFDHRVLDGATAARMLVELEQTLLGDILEEVRAPIPSQTGYTHPAGRISQRLTPRS